MATGTLPEDNMAIDTAAEPQGDAHHQPEPEVRPNALHEANIIHSAFFDRPLSSPSSATNNDSSANKAPSTKPKNERLCIGGHKETIFGMSFSPDGKYMASASQDSTICIWDVASHRLVTTLSKGINPNHECLRVAWMNTRYNQPTTNSDSDGGAEKYLLASSGADGIVRLWSASGEEGKLNWHGAGTLDHYTLEKDEEKENSGGETSGKEEDRPQVYALQFVHNKATPNMNILMTSANDCVYLWNIVDDDGSSQSPNDGVKRRKLLPFRSVRFSHLDDGRNVNQFGGARNPDNELYVFDASYSEANGLLGVALSDGTCRVLPLASGDNMYQDQCILSLPPGYFPGSRGGHLTALSWDKSGTRLATCIASGRVVLWLLQVVNKDGAEVLHPSCISVLEGGHDVGRPLFGAKYCGGKNEELLMTWGVDGKVCLWDSYSVGEVLSPMCTLISHSNYPIYALDITEYGSNSIPQADENQRVHVAVGGGADGGFLGVPAYLYGI